VGVGVAPVAGDGHRLALLEPEAGVERILEVVGPQRLTRALNRSRGGEGG
jgi:hypothetical protein